jgi:hypothetical protein
MAFSWPIVSPIQETCSSHFSVTEMTASPVTDNPIFAASADLLTPKVPLPVKTVSENQNYSEVHSQTSTRVRPCHVELPSVG